MRIVTLVKVVPDVAQLQFDRDKKTMIREGVKNVINPFDRRAVEESVRIKEKVGGHVTLLSMGPPQVEEVLRQTLVVGVDRAVLLTDRAFAGADTLATATALSMAALKLGFDLMLGGVASVDSETSQVVPEVAEMTKVNLITNAKRIQVIAPGVLRVDREFEEGVEQFDVKLPAAISVNEKINKPRSPAPEQKEETRPFGVERWAASHLSGDSSLFGAAGSPTNVKSIFDAAYDRVPFLVDGSVDLDAAVTEAMVGVERRLVKSSGEHVDIEKASDAREAWSVFLRGRAEVTTGKETLGKLKGIGLSPVAVFVGQPEDASVLSTVGRAGAIKTFLLRSDGLNGWSSSAWADALAQAISLRNPYAVFIPSTVRGREVAALVAARLRLGLTGDATDLTLQVDGGLIQVKPSSGGNIMAEIQSRTFPQMATVRPGVFQEADLGSSEVQEESLNLSVVDAGGVNLVSRSITMDSGLGDLDRAKVVIIAGYGVGSQGGFDWLKSFAARVGAAVGATRKVVDFGWAPPQVQVGLTGKSVRPDLLIEIGTSGSINHTIGVRRARVVLAINNDQEASIFKFCDVGLVADYREALQKLEDRLRLLVQRLHTGSLQTPT